MCVICEQQLNAETPLTRTVNDLMILECSYCPVLTHMPNIIGLQNLKCICCYELTHIPNIIGLKVLDCEECHLLSHIPNIIGLKILNCTSCHQLTEIPNIIGLQYLNCEDCQALTQIPLIQGLKTLRCYDCPLLENISMIQGLEKLYCNIDSQSTQIQVSMIEGLKKLYCFSNFITSINCFISKGLQKFWCVCSKLRDIKIKNISSLQCIRFLSCSSLYKISIINLNHLKSFTVDNCDQLIDIEIDISDTMELFWCYNCKSLKEINLNIKNDNKNKQFTINCQNCPSLLRIKTINIKNIITPINPIEILSRDLHDTFCTWKFLLINCPSLTSIPSFTKCISNVNIYQITTISRCKWLEKDNSRNFISNIKNLIILQKWFKRILLSIRLIKMIQNIIPIYYYPDYKGGYFHKKMMIEFIQQI